mgnify:FL=1
MEIRYTDEQLEAITTPVYNTMISAGAGSGKTKVLTQRVFNHLANNIDVDRLLVLTFTNAAAAEMKQRVIKLLVEDNSLDPDLKKAQLNKIDSAYIMTFDAYSLFLVKKYHQLLNVDKDIDIADSNIINGITDKFLDEIFEQQYVSNDIFKDIISKYCVKDDDVVKGFVKSLNKKLDLIYDRDNFIKTYNDLFFSTSHLNNELDSYTSLLLQKLKQVDELLNKISELDDLNRFFNNWQGINNLSSYEEVRSYVANISAVRKKNKEEYDEDALILKDKIKDIIKDINELTKYDKSTLFNDVLINKDYVNCLLELAEELNRRINVYKKENNLYDFIDIAKLAIEVVDKNEEIRESIKNNFYEILIDEYQDTSDIQELLISKISNNNVYVVGDIKQSIYRFRYANPDIFKKKYEDYSKGIGGKKIDLTNNFRSRFEVLRDINLFFNKTMSSSVGGADYTNGHQLVAGNLSYLKDEKYKCEILSYEKQKGVDSAYIEAQLIADDIKQKVHSFQLKDHLCDYRDITILVDRSSKFDVFKEVLTANNIPTFIETEEKMSESDLLTVIRSIFKLLVNYDKHAYISLERSFLCETSDEDIFNNIKNNIVFDSPTYIKINNIKSNIDTKTISNILDEIMDSFDVYSKLVKIKDVHASNVKIDYLYQLANNLNNLGYTYKDFNDYLVDVFDREDDIKFRIGSEVENAVRITNYHKSKGLEYNVVYYPCLSYSFNQQDKKGDFLFDKNHGIIMPAFINNRGLRDTFIKELYKYNYDLEDIGEKIRLFYVALTRAKEKMIIINSFDEKIDTVDYPLDDMMKASIKNYSTMLTYIKNDLNHFIVNIDIPEILENTSNKDIFTTLTKSNKLVLKPNIEVIPQEVTTSHFSKSAGLIDQTTLDKMELGTKIHYYLEMLDFKNPDYSYVDNKYINKIKQFMNSPLLENIKEAKIFKEYEFMDNGKHGFIDLLLEYKDKIVIIDYKTKNIDDVHYDEQLNGYRTYIESLTSKPVYCYLYSIIDETYREVVK